VHPTVTTALEAAVASSGGITFVASDETEVRLPWREIVERARRVAGGLRARGVTRGHRIAIVLRTSPEFLDVFFGAILAGAVPVPMYPPLRLTHLGQYRTQTARMAREAGARLVVSDKRIRWVLADAVVVDDLLAAEPIDAWPAAAGDPALVQFSSGTTGAPRPIALTHGQLAEHLSALLALVAPPGSRTVGVSWLPLYHDMGLIGCLLGSAFLGGELVLIAPEDFLARPALWLRAIGRHRGTISPAPSFAYGLCVRRVREEEMAGVDLSSWKLALDGAEQVSPEAARKFAARFVGCGFDAKAITPVYGLAEATLAVTFSAPGRGLVTQARGREVACVGRPIPGVDVDVRGGRIHVRAPWIDEEWLDTGDLGFIDEGELYVTGRAKDVIVLRGKNHDPGEIEEAIADVAGVRPGCAVAVGYLPPEADEEQLLVLAEIYPETDEDQARAEVMSAISYRLGLRAHEVALLAPGTLPRTSSGKLQRGEALRRYLDDDLEPPHAPSRWRLALEGLRARLAHALR
jgi:acyl-CoA synthetase (AMP-forming)/AMP-acid ligase II